MTKIKREKNISLFFTIVFIVYITYINVQMIDNQIKISGLPFASANFSNGEQVGGADPFFQDGFFNANDFSGIVNNNSSVIQLVRRSDGTSLTGTSVNGGRQIRVSFWYMTA